MGGGGPFMFLFMHSEVYIISNRCPAGRDGIYLSVSQMAFGHGGILTHLFPWKQTSRRRSAHLMEGLRSSPAGETKIGSSCHYSAHGQQKMSFSSRFPRRPCCHFHIRFKRLIHLGRVGMENAVNSCKVQPKE
jgi:hypothetical protein